MKKTFEETLTNEQKRLRQGEEFNKKVDDLDEESLPTANILVAGITGTGKSTLINAVFGKALADTGMGKPVTDHITDYEQEDLPVHIWDTVGLELDSEKTKSSIAAIKRTISSKAEEVTDGNYFHLIHAIWYCINSGSKRYQGAELDFIKELHSIGVPFIIVLTQCFGDEDEVNGFEENIKSINSAEGMEDIEVVQVLAKDFSFKGWPQPIPAFGLDNLVNTTLKLLPDFLKNSFIAAQTVSRDEKRKCCEEIIFDNIKIAQNGFWIKVPLIKVFSTDHKIKKMFRSIGEMYNLPNIKEGVDKLVKICAIDAKNNFSGLISPFHKKYTNKILEKLEEKKKNGFAADFEDFDKDNRSSMMIAFYGYIFIESIEELWDKSNESELKNVQDTCERLVKIINKKLSGK